MNARRGPLSPDSNRLLLNDTLVKLYEQLKSRLTKRFGSAETATELLHETFLRVHEPAVIGEVRQPQSYLYRIALNVAADSGRAARRRDEGYDIDAVHHAEIDQPDMERVVDARSELRALESALAELPELRQAIFIAAIVDEEPYKSIARRYGVSLRTVEREIARVLRHCRLRLQRAPSERPIGEEP
jgi:RNA polymerase sigma-70 factor (ECF subfamily)